jgi:C-terminal processing protease CtpA/Prc
MEAGILIGTPSLGGACAINVTVLPDGSIFVASSNMVLMNANDEITEFGITPDIVITEYIDDITELDYNSYVN